MRISVLVLLNDIAWQCEFKDEKACHHYGNLSEGENGRIEEQTDLAGARVS